MADFIQGDYEYTIVTGTNNVRARVVDTTKTSYADIPSTVTNNDIVYTVTNLCSEDRHTGCFQNCTNLTQTPFIPDTVVDMENGFMYCSALIQPPILPNNVENISYCFYGCGLLSESPVIPTSVLNLEKCFYNCSALITMPKIPNGVTNMFYCFENCSSLTEISEIPESVVNMAGCFCGCSALEEVPIIPNNITDLTKCFYGCASLKKAPIIPSNVINITDCFRNCSLEGTIMVYNNPSNYTTAFTDAVLSSLQIIYLGGQSAGYATWSTIASQYNTVSMLTITDGVEIHISDYLYIMYYNSSLNKYTAHVMVYEESANNSNNGILLNKSYYMPIESPITINNIEITVTNLTDCFADCTLLVESPSIPNTVTDMSGCFYNCELLAEAPEIPVGVTDMSECFQNCFSLSVTPNIPNTVISLSRAFKNCSALITAPTIPNNVIYMNECFYGCESLITTPILSNNVIDLSRCFYGCILLTQLPSIPNSVTNMYRCFEECINIGGNIIVNNNFSNIEDSDRVFYNTINLIYIVNGGDANVSKWRNIANNYDNVHYEADDFNIFLVPEHHRSVLPFGSNYKGRYLNHTLTLEVSNVLPVNWTYDIIDIDYQINSISQLVNWNKTVSNNIIIYSNSILWHNINSSISIEITYGYKKDINTSWITKAPLHYNYTLYQVPEGLQCADFRDGDYVYCIVNGENNESWLAVTVADDSKNKNSYNNLPDIKTYENNTYYIKDLCAVIELPDGTLDYGEGCYENCINLINAPSLNQLTHINNLSRCFKNCRNLVSITNIPASTTLLQSCFEDCINLEGNIIVSLYNIQNYDNIFANTVKPIYIIRDINANIQNTDIEQWREIAALFNNVHFEADDNGSPKVSIISINRVKKSEDEWISTDVNSTHIKGNIAYSVVSNFLPVNWRNEIVSKNAKIDYKNLFDATENIEENIWMLNEQGIIVDANTGEPIVFDQYLPIVWEDNVTFYIQLKDKDEEQHDVTIAVTDLYEHEGFITRTVLGTFAMLDFVPGGKGLAIGSVAKHNGLEITLPTAIGMGLSLPSDKDNKIALDNYQLIIGKYNEVQNNALFIIGNGADAQHTSNVFVVDEEGNLKVQDGFSIINNEQNYLQLSSVGINIVNNNMNVASFSNVGIRVGDPSAFHIEIDNNELGFWKGVNTQEKNKIAYINGEKLHITKSVVLQQMDVGTPLVETGNIARGGQWSWCVHENNLGTNNLYLKWLG